MLYCVVVWGVPDVAEEKLQFHSFRTRSGSRISGKGVHIYKCMGVRFADFIPFFLNIR